MGRGSGLSADDVLYGQLSAARSPSSDARVCVTRDQLKAVADQIWTSCDFAYQTGKEFSYPVYSETGQLIGHEECDAGDLIVEMQNLVVDTEDKSLDDQALVERMDSYVKRLEEKSLGPLSLSRSVAEQALPIVLSFNNLVKGLVDEQ